MLQQIKSINKHKPLEAIKKKSMKKPNNVAVNKENLPILSSSTAKGINQNQKSGSNKKKTMDMPYPGLNITKTSNNTKGQN